jgi:hypothetical protein
MPGKTLKMNKGINFKDTNTEENTEENRVQER